MKTATTYYLQVFKNEVDFLLLRALSSLFSLSHNNRKKEKNDPGGGSVTLLD